MDPALQSRGTGALEHPVMEYGMAIAMFAIRSAGSPDVAGSPLRGQRFVGTMAESNNAQRRVGHVPSKGSPMAGCTHCE